MPSSDDAEKSVYRAAKDGLTRWLGRARDAVLAPWRQMKAHPSPSAIDSTLPEWQAQVDRILAALEPSIREGWAAANLPGDLTRVDPYIQANLALTKNLLVRIPDEVHAKVVAAILTGVNKQETNEQIANRVQDILTYTGSEDWDGRAKLIAQTETNRHFNSSMLAHGLLQEKHGRQDLYKQWDTRMDGHERPAHHLANGQERPLGQPFVVGGEPLLFPVDPRGRPDNVIGCVTGDAVIIAAGVSVGYRFEWYGPTVTFTWSDGSVSTVSPNHPVLTEFGWAPACQVQKGDDLLGARLRHQVEGIGVRSSQTPQSQPYIQGAPATAEQVFLALVGVGHCERMDDLPVNFHGDRPTGYVDIVLSDRELSFGIDSTLEQPFEQLMLTYSNSFHPSISDTAEFTLSESFTARRVMSGSNLPATSRLRHASPFAPLRVGPPTDRNPSFFKVPGDHQSRYAEPFGKGIGRDSLVDVLVTKVVNVEVDLSPGHVTLYTFQTSSGVYLADNVAAKNCRCELRVLGGTNGR